MKTIVLLAAIAVSSALACDTPAYGTCGNDEQGAQCCPDNQYCVPWNPSYYGCQNVPDQCPEQHTNIDFYGDDLEMVSVSQPGECCSACAAREGCRAYSYVNNNPGSPACYLKSGQGEWRDAVGVVSGVLASRRLRVV